MIFHFKLANMCIKELPRSRNLELGLSGYYCLEKQKTFETLMLYLFCNPTYLMFFSDMMNDIFSSPRLEVCRAELTKEGGINQFDERHEHGTCGWKLVDIINRCHQGFVLELLRWSMGYQYNNFNLLPLWHYSEMCNQEMMDNWFAFLGMISRFRRI